MTASLQLRLKGYIQPFERRLGLAELTALAGSAPIQQGHDDREYLLEAPLLDAQALSARLAYWESIGGGHDLTTQVLREATAVAGAAHGSLDTVPERPPIGSAVPIPKRRLLRYGPHGIHEYRGKFFPQLVRALLNIARIDSGGLVADPMIGSGTTAVEGVLAGCRVLGLDMNPLSVFMARTKCGLLTTSPEVLVSEHRVVSADLRRVASERERAFRYVPDLPSDDQRYLASWFTEETLVQLDSIAAVIQAQQPGPPRDLMWLAFSNILRRVSLQKTDDLRVRRVPSAQASDDVFGMYAGELARSVRVVAAFLWQAGVTEANYDIREGDARAADQAFVGNVGQVDAIITSPPYATALPYLDTDRLSLCFLGLRSRSDVRRLDVHMIGNREISERQRVELWRRYSLGGDELPESVRALVDRVDQLNKESIVGFRRRNLAALLGKYFSDMKSTLAGSLRLLKPRGYAFIVVGNNRTTAGTTPVNIGTAQLLSDTAEMVGFELVETIDMEMLVARDIHRRNSLPTEQILVLRSSSTHTSSPTGA